MRHVSKIRIKRAVPTILTVVAAIGCVGSVISAINDTPKALKLIEQTERARGEPLDKIEKVKVVLPAYIPTMALTVGTISAIFGANVCNKRQQAALVSAYSMLDASFKRYRKTANECFGEDADKHISENVAFNEFQEQKFPKPNKPDTYIFYDEYSNRFFERTMLEVQNAAYHLNRNFCIKGAVDLNEWYLFLGLDTTDFGSTVGWSDEMYDFYGYAFIDFVYDEVTEVDGSFIAIRMPFPPVPEFMGEE